MTPEGAESRSAAPPGGRRARHRSPHDRQVVRRSAGSPTVRDLLAAVERFAPFTAAADWDNVGLLAGAPSWPAKRILLAIDLTDDVAREALRKRCDALLLYHPPIFKGIRSVTADADAPTKLLPDLLAARVALLAVHTALDAAIGGTNDAVLDAFSTRLRFPLQPSEHSAAEFKLVVFVPPADVDRLRAALSAAGAGVIGNYSECSFELHGRGSFRGNAASNPAIGRPNQLERVDESRLEMLVPQARLAAAVRALYAVHPYEEPAFDLYPLHSLAGRGQVGLGRVGILTQPATGDALLAALSKSADLSSASVVGSLQRRFSSVTAAAGAFGERAFRQPDSLVITGELKHHEALQLLRRGVTAVCLGHCNSERPGLRALAGQLAGELRAATVSIAQADRPPFQPLSLRTKPRRPRR